MLHLSGHDRLLDALFLEETNHPSQLADANPLDAFGALVHLGIRLFADRRNYQRHTRLAGAFDNHEGKLAVARNQPEFHLVTPRSELSMKRKRSETSAETLISSLMRSTACVVFSLAERRRGEAWCRASMAARE